MTWSAQRGGEESVSLRSLISGSRFETLTVTGVWFVLEGTWVNVLGRNVTVVVMRICHHVPLERVPILVVR